MGTRENAMGTRETAMEPGKPAGLHPRKWHVAYVTSGHFGLTWVPRYTQLKDGTRTGLFAYPHAVWRVTPA